MAYVQLQLVRSQLRGRVKGRRLRIQGSTSHNTPHRWLAEKMGAKPTTMSGLSGLGDIMLTCYGR